MGYQTGFRSVEGRRGPDVKMQFVPQFQTYNCKGTKACSTVQPTCPPCPTVKYGPCDRCEAGWEHHGGKCYHFSISKSSWNQSRAECRAEGGDLVKIDSREEQNFLEKRLREMNKTERNEQKFWIGLIHSAEEDRWIWIDGSPLNKSLTFWSRNQLDTRNGTNRENAAGQSCVRVGEKGRAPDLKLASCKKAQSICEKPAV
ncbi:hepatic lectin-like [Archocentrus centrarchus]|uniref:hepatic lectin-like n=1 Tax=Archocentrus centrarchus TaxID=63155 RepID=UPI0011E9DD05|nr:hepatic lectin-like [Archocentrus centrarchus]